MPTLVIALRVVSLLAFAAPMLLVPRGHRRDSKAQAPQVGHDRRPLAANLAAFGVYAVALLLFSGSPLGSPALLFAASGSLLALAGSVLIVRSRAELGSAWSFAPKTDQATGFITSGPYRLVRHPIYLGLALLATGQSLAFDNWVALTIVLFGILPTLVWRAREEEQLLNRAFGERYAIYQQQTKMIFPCLF